MSTKEWIYIAVGLGVAILLVLLLGVVLGWFKAGQLKLVEGEGNVDRTASGAIDESRYISIAKNSKESLEGLNWQSSYFTSVANTLLQLNYNELRLVNNIYLTKFASSEIPSLRRLIMGEYVGQFGPCTENEKIQVQTPCWLQEKVIKKLDYIKA